MKLILNDNEPIFVQIAKALEDEIISDGIMENNQIPSTTELSKLYKINPATILKGVNMLVEKNILYKKRGIGIFVCEGAKKIISESRKDNFKNVYIKEFLEEAKKIGIDKQELVEIINKSL